MDGMGWIKWIIDGSTTLEGQGWLKWKGGAARRGGFGGAGVGASIACVAGWRAGGQALEPWEGGESCDWLG